MCTVVISHITAASEAYPSFWGEALYSRILQAITFHCGSVFFLGERRAELRTIKPETHHDDALLQQSVPTKCKHNSIGVSQELAS